MSDTQVVTDPNAPQSVEYNGRTLTGVGVTHDQLAETVATLTREEPETRPSSGAPVPEDRKTRGQKRIDAITAEREAAKRETADLKADRDRLAAELEAAKAPKPPAVPAPPVAATATRTKPTEDQVGTKYASYGDYLEDLADWKTDQRLSALDLDARIRTSLEADRASRTLTDTKDQVFARGRQAYPDFGATIDAMPAIFSRELLEWVLGRPPGESEHLAYRLAKDRPYADTFLDKWKTDKVELGRWLMAEGRVSPTVRVAQTPASTPPRDSLPAPAPYQPVGSGSPTTSPASSELVGKAGYDFDKSGYREKRAAELGRGVRRR